MEIVYPFGGIFAEKIPGLGARMVKMIPCPAAHVIGIEVVSSSGSIAVYVRRHGARSRRWCVTIIMRLTKEFTYDYNLNTDSLQEVIT